MGNKDFLLGVKVDKNTVRMLDQYAQQTNQNRSEVVRMLLDIFEKQVKIPQVEVKNHGHDGE